ncbi:hypothetical protein CHN49_20930 [Pseudomonas putida]|nr:hypothetical protein CHN49_20930 [Pseudomonas putida]
MNRSPRPSVLSTCCFPIAGRWPDNCSAFCGSGLVSRMGCEAPLGSQLRCRYCRGRFAALSRHKAASTTTAKF